MIIVMVVIVVTVVIAVVNSKLSRRMHLLRSNLVSIDRSVTAAHKITVIARTISIVEFAGQR